jgi:hypothetical protein
MHALSSFDLKRDVSLDADIGSVDVGSVNGHVHVGLPGGVAPFKVEAVVGTQVGSQAAVVRKAALPLDRHVPSAANGRGNSVLAVCLLGHGIGLPFRRRSQTDVGAVVAMADLNVLAIILQIQWGVTAYLTFFRMMGP